MVSEEALHSDPVREFALRHNRRFGPPRPGEEWVRVRPPTVGEARDLARDGRCVRFARVGSLVSVTAVWRFSRGTRMVDLSCGGWTLSWDLEGFLGTFVKAVHQDSWGRSDALLVGAGC